MAIADMQRAGTRKADSNLDERLQQEIKRQVREGYDWFKENASQLWLPHPEISVLTVKDEELSDFLRSSGVDNAAKGAKNMFIASRVTLSQRGGNGSLLTKASLQVYSEGLNTQVCLGSYIHEGAETALNAIREYRGLPVSRWAGEFVGNYAIADKTGRLPSHLIVFEWGFRLLSGMHLKINGREVPNFMRASVLKECGLSGLSNLIYTLSPEYRDAMERAQCQVRDNTLMRPYLEANEFISDWPGKNNPALKKGFLRFLAEADYQNLGISRIFQQFQKSCSQSYSSQLIT